MSLQPHEKTKVQLAYRNNNNIAGVCNLAVCPIKYDELPVGVRTQIKTVYDYLWEGGLEIKRVVAWSLTVDCEPKSNTVRKESWMQIFNIETRYKAKIAKDSYKWKERIRSKYRLQRNRAGFLFTDFQIDILNDFEDYKNYDNGILMKYFDTFIVNDPHFEANLTGIGVI
jgi:hypothetical protein